MVPLECERRKPAVGTAIINASDMRQTEKRVTAEATDRCFDPFSADDAGVSALVGK